jgi:hypothetical protein
MKKTPSISVINKKTTSELFFNAINKLSYKPKSRNYIFKKEKGLFNKTNSINFIEEYDEKLNGEVCFEMGGIGFDFYGNPIRWE